MTTNCRERELQHKALLQKCYDGKYASWEDEIKEFTWDGPSNWKLWCSQKPGVLFLAKEAHSGYHPSVPNQEISNKGGKNIARWNFAIQSLYEDRNKDLAFPDDSQLPGASDAFAIVEVKKLQEDNKVSKSKEINEYAKEDRDCLKEQIRLIGPHVIVCCGTSDAYDIIFKDTPEIEAAITLNSIDKYKCWKVGERLVIEFHHQSAFPDWVDPSDEDYRLFDTLCELLDKGNVFENFNW